MLGDLVKNIRERELIEVVWLNLGLDDSVGRRPILVLGELVVGSSSWMVENSTAVVGRK